MFNKLFERKKLTKINVYGKIKITKEKNYKIRLVVLNLFGLIEIKIKILIFIWSMLGIFLLVNYFLLLFLLLLTFHVSTSEQHWHGKNRPWSEQANKKSVSKCECDFCGPSFTSSCSDALRTVDFFILVFEWVTANRVRVRILCYKTLLRSTEAYASRLYVHQDKRR